MKAPKTRKLIILSSTMRTLIGGTDPSRRPAGRLGASTGFGFFRLGGRGDDTLGVGGDDPCRTKAFSVGAGGVGIGAFDDAECFASEAEES